MPLLIPSAIETSPVSTTALHIAHWENEVDVFKNTKINTSRYLKWLSIVWRYH